MTWQFADEQILGLLREAEVGAMSIKTLCKKHNVTEQAFFRWRTTFGVLDVPNAADSRTSSPRTPGSSRG